jgi:hypothetical protein
MPPCPGYAERRLLILSPLFFGYHKAMLEAASRIGIAADWIDVRASKKVAYKVALKVAPGLTRQTTQRTLEAALAQVDWSRPPTDILIIKGDGLTAATLKKLRGRAPAARVTLYMWDGVDNVPGVMKIAAGVDRRVTFDPIDAEALGWEFLPLFFRQAPRGPDPETDMLWDWSFVGSIHSDRHRILSKLAAAHTEARWRVHAFVPNALVRAAYAIRDPGLLLPGPVPVTHSVLTATEVEEISARSRAIVDIQHPRQTGLTMRTIETLLAGSKLITTNQTLKMYDLYHPSRIAVLDRDYPRLDPEFLQMPFDPIPAEIVQSYHIDTWLARLLSDAPLVKVPTVRPG